MTASNETNSDRATVDEFARAISPAFAAIEKFTYGAGEPQNRGGARLNRSLRRFRDKVRETVVEEGVRAHVIAAGPIQAPTSQVVARETSKVAERPAKAAESIFSPEFKRGLKLAAEAAATIPEDLRIESQRAGFRTTLAIAQIRQWFSRARRQAKNAREAAKFVDGAKVSAEGAPVGFAPAKLAASVLLVGVLAVASLSMLTGRSVAMLSNQIDDQRFEHALTMTPSFRAAPLPLEVYFRGNVPAAFATGASMQVEIAPSQNFLDRARTALASVMGDAQASVHLDRALEAFKACARNTTPCRVDTFGLSFDAADGRFLATLEAQPVAIEQSGRLFDFTRGLSFAVDAEFRQADNEFGFHIGAEGIVVDDPLAVTESARPDSSWDEAVEDSLPFSL